MAYTQVQLDALQAALADGVRSVDYDGKSVTYRSVDDMLKLEIKIKRELGLLVATSVARTTFDRGLK